MTPEDARAALNTRLLGRVADRLLLDGRLDELTVLVRMSPPELEVLAMQEHRARAQTDDDLWRLLVESDPALSVAV